MLKSAVRALAFVYVPLGVVLALDYFTDPKLSFSFLYLLPILAAVLLMGVRGAAICAACATLCSLAVALLAGTGPALALWNTGM